ncbi:hypothetical protein [Mobiluncus curtisii]|uniref:hypothetical protein n=1 Tax=Mobiluncus curtisii TaxID=2051 RepID=UPI00146FECC4|nr:hypothetical protein [Mobiluncus curtisii]MCU9986707.1 hypothetical protein [Mobiluncus curtisii]MCV0020103.1 hypothetical protein [Mobiluncus curtisii]NMX12727.1 hypothetical protein [Mobiluncus curtisii]
MTVQDKQGNLHKSKDPDGGQFAQKQYGAAGTGLDQQDNSERLIREWLNKNSLADPQPTIEEIEKLTYGRDMLESAIENGEDTNYLEHQRELLHDIGTVRRLEASGAFQDPDVVGRLTDHEVETLLKTSLRAPLPSDVYHAVSQRLRHTDPKWGPIFNICESIRAYKFPNFEDVDSIPDGDYVLYLNEHCGDFRSLQIRHDENRLCTDYTMNGSQTTTFWDCDAGCPLRQESWDTDTGRLVGDKEYFDGGERIIETSYHSNGTPDTVWDMRDGTVDALVSYTDTGKVHDACASDMFPDAPSKEDYFPDGTIRRRYWSPGHTRGGLFPYAASYREDGSLERQDWRPTFPRRSEDFRYSHGLPAAVCYDEDGNVSDIIYGVQRCSGLVLKPCPKPANAVPLDEKGMPSPEDAKRIFGIDNLEDVSRLRDANVYDARETAAMEEMAKLQGRGEPSAVRVRELSEKYGVPEKRLYWLHEM